MVRRCKYQAKKVTTHICSKELLRRWDFYCLYDDTDGCIIYYPECPNYIPVELDPEWLDIFNETNRRLNG